jgi:glycosyltransferase involved in cell wall biosynthesis
MSVYEPKQFEPRIYDIDTPLVSVLVYNYNYGRYLEECLESIAAQTYNNIEVIFSDNASTDHSWEIALAFVKKYPGLMTITRNRKNLGVDANFRNCFLNLRGKYFINMCSDDVLTPQYIEKCVKVMESNTRLGYVMVHRAILDKDGNRLEEAPFYNQSCTIEGADKAAVYMMAAVNPSVSQIMYDVKKTADKTATGSLVSRWYGTRILDFNLCTEYQMAYINEPLMLHRIHGENDSLSAADNLLEVIGPYVLHHQFADTAANFNMQKVVERLPASIDKLAKLSLRYCVRGILKNDLVLARKYYFLALAMSDSIESDPVFVQLSRYWQGSEQEKAKILQELNSTDDLVTRAVSYDPPANSKVLDI